MNHRIWGLVLVLALVQACSRESADELFSKGEAATHNDATYAMAEEHLDKFLKYYPDDPRADLALHALGRVLMSQQRHPEAIGRYTDLLRRFPKSRYADQAQFMVAYMYDLEGKLEEARVAYQKVIDTFPNSELVDDAQVSIANLGKVPEAWFPVSDEINEP